MAAHRFSRYRLSGSVSQVIIRIIFKLLHIKCIITDGQLKNSFHFLFCWFSHPKKKIEMKIWCPLQLIQLGLLNVKLKRRRRGYQQSLATLPQRPKIQWTVSGVNNYSNVLNIKLGHFSTFKELTNSFMVQVSTQFIQFMPVATVADFKGRSFCFQKSISGIFYSLTLANGCFRHPNNCLFIK